MSPAQSQKHLHKQARQCLIEINTKEINFQKKLHLKTFSSAGSFQCQLLKFDLS